MSQVEFRPCKQQHLGLIRPQAHDRELLAGYMSPEFAHLLENSFAISGWVGNQPVAAAGIIPIHAGVSYAWAMLAEDCGPYLLPVTRKVRNALDMWPGNRIEMRVTYDFAEGHRWAKLLGFTKEAERMRKSGVRGEDETMYARVK